MSLAFAPRIPGLPAGFSRSPSSSASPKPRAAPRSPDAFTAAGLAFITALIAIALMMAWLKRASFTPFVIYRIILGLFLLAVVYGHLGPF